MSLLVKEWGRSNGDILSNSPFYYHSDEDRIVLSHALFWVMAQSIKGKIAKEKYFMLLRIDKTARKLAAITIVAVGYGGDMDESLCNGLLDDIDFRYNRVKCRKIEHLLPQLNKMVETEAASLMLL